MEANVSCLQSSKYDELILEAKKNDWKVHTIIVEVGAKGWIPSNTMSALSSLGLCSPKDLCNRLSHNALKSSYVLWINRFNKNFELGWKICI